MVIEIRKACLCFCCCTHSSVTIGRQNLKNIEKGLLWYNKAK